ncbi:MAG: ribonuclease, partial [Acidobacteriaceae bacterium]|nr:ribonuclease [Acidobacteriaceae bacterium]
MSKELVIGSNRHETKVAILEDDQLVEIYFQRANEYSLAGSIHKGRVTRVLPGMQSAFVDLGLERDTFLYVSDFFEEHEDIDTVSDEKPVRRERSQNRPPERPPQPVVESSPAERESDLRAADLPESESTATAGVTAAGEPS